MKHHVEVQKLMLNPATEVICVSVADGHASWSTASLLVVWQYCGVCNIRWHEECDYQVGWHGDQRSAHSHHWTEATSKTSEQVCSSWLCVLVVYQPYRVVHERWKPPVWLLELSSGATKLLMKVLGKKILLKSTS